jgi:hypothetical protein
VPKKGRPQPPQKQPQGALVAAPDKAIPLEDRLIELLVMNPSKNLAAARQYITAEDLENPRNRMIFSLLLENNGFSDALLMAVDEETRKTLANIAMKSENGPPEDVSEIQDILLKTRENRLKRERSEIKRKMALPGADVDSLLKSFNEVSVELKRLRA